MKIEVLKTSDGSQTLYLPEMKEQYHSQNGAITESNYVYLTQGYNCHSNKTPTVFEIGFGTGLNCLLTAIQANKEKRHTIYYTIEKYPLEINIIQQLNYGSSISEEAKIIFNKIHNCEWNQLVEISEYFSLYKIEGDLINHKLEAVKNCDIIYFDAFGPEKQPEMWTKVIFEKIYSLTSSNGIIVTYSAKGDVKRQLRECGYKIKRLPGPPGKFHMLRGIK